MKKFVDSKDTALHEIIALLTKEFKPKKVFLFGSHARREATKESDYDLLLIIKESSQSPLERMERAQDLLWNTNAPPVDIFILTEEEFEKSALDFGSIAESAVSEGREISLDLFT